MAHPESWRRMVLLAYIGLSLLFPVGCKRENPTDPVVASLLGTWSSGVQHSEIGKIIITMTFDKKSLHLRIDPAPGVHGSKLVDSRADYEVADHQLKCSLLNRGEAVSISFVDGDLILTEPDERTVYHRVR